MSRKKRQRAKKGGRRSSGKKICGKNIGGRSFAAAAELAHAECEEADLGRKIKGRKMAELPPPGIFLPPIFLPVVPVRIRFRRAASGTLSLSNGLCRSRVLFQKQRRRQSGALRDSNSHCQLGDTAGAEEGVTRVGGTMGSGFHFTGPKYLSNQAAISAPLWLSGT